MICTQILIREHPFALVEEGTDNLLVMCPWCGRSLVYTTGSNFQKADNNIRIHLENHQACRDGFSSVTWNYIPPFEDAIYLNAMGIKLQMFAPIAPIEEPF